MTKKIVGAGLAVVFVTAGVLAPPAGAQVRVQSPRASQYDAIVSRSTGSMLGVSVRDLSAEEVAAARLPQAGGAVVEEVREGGPAARAGVQRGDVVVEFDGERVRSRQHLTRLVQETPAGRTVAAVVLRDGSRRTIDITPDARAGLTLDALPDLGRDIERSLQTLPRALAMELDVPRSVVLMAPGRLGATLLPLDRQLAEYFGVTQGVLVSSVDPDTPASRAGLRAGDVITDVNNRRVSRVSDVADEVRKAPAESTLQVRVVREKTQTTLAITLPPPRRPVVRAPSI
jgi:serine protease Do